MTERIADPQAVCPFVALDDDRDHRAPGPDHRHRCFAESPAAPRALAHQAAYCLSGSFAGCPTFVRLGAPRSGSHAGRPRGALPARRRLDARRDPAPTGRSDVAVGWVLGDWTAPPPWGLAAGAAQRSGPQPPGGPGRPSRARSMPTPAAGGTSADFVSVDVAPLADASAGGRPGRPTGLPRGSPGPSNPDPRLGRGRGLAHEPGADVDPGEGEPIRVPVAAPRRMPVGYAPVAPGKGDRQSGGSRQGRVDASAPSWEQPRHFEEYPTLRSRGRAGIPRVAIYALVVLLVGAALFIAPSSSRASAAAATRRAPRRHRRRRRSRRRSRAPPQCRRRSRSCTS